MSKFTKQNFDQCFNHADTLAVEFNPAWQNNQGYFNHAVRGEHAPMVAEGRIVKSTDQFGRKLLIIGTRCGNCVVFERHCGVAIGSDTIYVGNYPLALTKLRISPHGAITEDGMISLIGTEFGERDNIGKRLAEFLKYTDLLMATA